jgi:hypothetical protein
MFWHVGFPLLVIAYTRLEISRGAASGGPGRALAETGTGGFPGRH